MKNTITQLMAEELSALDMALLDLESIEGSSFAVTEEPKETSKVELKEDPTLDLSDALDELDELLLDSVNGEIEMEEITKATYAELPAETAEISPTELSDTDMEVMKKDVAAETALLGEKVETDLSPTRAEPKKTTPKARAGASLKPSEALKVRLGGIETVHATLIHSPDDATLSVEDLKLAIETRMKDLDDAPKKVAEKVVNAYSHLTGNASLSVYTELVLEILFAQGEITSQDIFNKYRARPYSEGTSRSQSGQLMKVLPLMGIAKRDGNKLTLIEDSVMAHAFSEKLGLAISVPTAA